MSLPLILLAGALVIVIVIWWLWANARHHCPVTDPAEQKEMVARFREAGG